MTEEEILQAHKDRVAVLLEKYGDKFKIPQDEIARLQDANKQDWINHVADRDKRARRAERVTEPAPVAVSRTVNAGSVADAERALAAFTGHEIDPSDPRIGKP